MPVAGSKYDSFKRRKFHDALATLVPPEDVNDLANKAGVWPQILSDFYHSNPEEPAYLTSIAGEKILNALQYESFPAFYEAAKKKAESNEKQTPHGQRKRKTEQEKQEAAAERQRQLEDAKRRAEQIKLEAEQSKQQKREEAQQRAVQAKLEEEEIRQQKQEARVAAQQEKQRRQQEKQAQKEASATDSVKKPYSGFSFVCEHPFGQAVKRLLELEEVSLGKFALSLNAFQFDLRKRKERSELLDIPAFSIKQYLQYEKDSPFGDDLRQLILSYYRVDNVEELTLLADILEHEKNNKEKPGVVLDAESFIQLDGRIGAHTTQDVSHNFRR